MWFNIPIRTWLLIASVAFLLIYWSLLAIFNTFDSFFSFRLQVRQKLAENKRLREQAEHCASERTRANLRLLKLSIQLRKAKAARAEAEATAKNQRNRAEGLEAELKSTRATVQMWRERAEKRGSDAT